VSAARGARLVAAGILLSRIAGLVRQKALAFFLGDSAAADALASAFRIPNVLQNLLGEGVLSASFIPAYARLRAEGRAEEAGRLAGAVVALLALVSSVVVLLGVLAAPFLVDLIAPGFGPAPRALTIRLVRVIFPGVGVLVLSAWCLGVLNAHRRFFLSYVSPVLWNAAMIVAVLIGAPGSGLDDIAVLVALASVVGSVLQFGVQLPMVHRLEPGLRFRPRLGDAALRGVIARFGTTVVGRGVVQLSGFVDTAIASLVGSGAVAILGYSQVLSLLPISLFGMAVSAAELPAMAGETGEPEAVASALRTRLDRGLDRIAYFVVPTVVAFVLVGELVVYGLFGGGAFTAETARWVHRTLIGAALGLLANTAGRLYASACYALGDAKTPFRGALLRVGLGGGLGWIGALGLPAWLGVDARWGLQALTVAAGVAAWVEYHWLRHRVTRAIGPTAVPTRRLLGYWAIAAVSVIGGLLVSVGGALLTRGSAVVVPGWVYAAVTAAVAAVVYFALTARFGIDDARRA